MPPLVALTLSLAIAAQIATPPAKGIEAEPGERQRCSLRTASPGDGGQPRNLPVELVEYDQEIDGAARSWNERHLALRVRGTKVMDSDHPELSASCDSHAVRLTWKGPGDGSATLSLMSSGRGLIVDPSLSRRLERAWKQGDAQDLAALGSLLEALPDALAPGPGVIAASRIVAAKQALQRGDFTLTEQMLGGLKLAPGSEWERRSRSVAGELERVRGQTQPISVGKALRLGTRKLVPTAPPLPHADVFWQGERACVAQEDQSPAREMRCFDTRARRWGAREPLRIAYPDQGEVQMIGGGNLCDYVDICWYAAPLPGENVCSGVPCKDLLAVLPGPRLILPGEDGLVAVDSLDGPATPLPGGIAPEELAKLPGSVLAGGQLYFSGSRLIDATRKGRSWNPFEGVVESAFSTVVSPDLRWAVVSARGKADQPISLWLVPLKPRQ